MGNDNLYNFDSSLFTATEITIGDVEEYTQWLKDGSVLGGGQKRIKHTYDPDVHTDVDVLRFWVKVGTTDFDEKNLSE